MEIRIQYGPQVGLNLFWGAKSISNFDSQSAMNKRINVRPPSVSFLVFLYLYIYITGIGFELARNIDKFDGTAGHETRSEPLVHENSHHI